VRRRFGSLRNALAELGWEAAWTPVADREILDALRAYARDHGRPPTVKVWRSEHRQAGASSIIRNYGSWSATLAAACNAERRR
jgi:hypothetical protein